MPNVFKSRSQTLFTWYGNYHLKNNLSQKFEIQMNSAFKFLIVSNASFIGIDRFRSKQ